jgi:hypothetical protein
LYVRTGRAVFVGPAAIRFIESDPRNIAAAKTDLLIPRKMS